MKSGTVETGRLLTIPETADRLRVSRVTVYGGTGAYTDLVGHGVDNGVASGSTGVGQISGFITQP